MTFFKIALKGNFLATLASKLYYHDLLKIAQFGHADSFIQQAGQYMNVLCVLSTSLARIEPGLMVCRARLEPHDLNFTFSDKSVRRCRTSRQGRF